MKRKTKRIPKGFEVLAELCQGFFAARDRVVEQVEKIRERRIKYTKRLIPGLRERAAELGEARDRIREYLEEHRGQFEKPRTRTLHGCKVGWRKKPGKLVIADEARTIQLIRTRMPEQARTLLQVKTTVNKAALKKLSAAELASVGAVIAAVDDEKVISFPKDNMDQLVDALLEDFEEAA